MVGHVVWLKGAVPARVLAQYAYDAAGRWSAMSYGGVTHAYGYDPAGRRSVVRSFAGNHAYGYDAVGRVISADNPSGLADEVFSYDDLGNRTSGGEQYDGAGRLTARSGFTYLSDREGRVTSRIASNGDTTEFGWSDDGRLESITLPDGTVQQVKYDPLGRRIATTDGAGGTLRQTYGLDPNAVVEDSGGDVSRMTFVLGYDQPLAMTTAAASVSFQQDALSSVTSLADQTGTVTGRYGYDTYGQITSHTGQDSPYTYTGRQYNPQAGIYDYRARWYEPDTGRFLTQDPVPAANQYWYADGIPVSANDPTGRMSVSEVATSDVVISALVTANANYWGSVIRCGVPDSVSDGAKILGLGALQGAIFGGLSSFIAKRIVAKVGEDGLTAAALALLAYGWVSSYPRHVVGNGDTHVDPFDPLGWLIDTIAQQGTGVGGEAWGSPMGKAVMAVLDTIAGTATSAAFGRCPG